ncbi:MobA/MobL family protein [Bacillus sp. NP157]|nr:MobA/MobL family protein [Bacillus sp. NP157]
MAEHARPHLHTHNRDRKHSAVAAAAYRLGIRLFDEQTDTWHDYSKRAGTQVVFGETIGPHGVPPWLLDPATLWNAVERAERRVDAQICRDYRIPIPLGLDEKAAIAMSRSMAGYLVERFNVPVCIAVHRDNTVDLDGKAKPGDKIGFHAHLLFPTRELVREDGGAGETWAFGRKLNELANSRMSSPIVDAMNEKWSRLANKHLAEAGLPETCESKSYKRLGLDKVPKPARARKFGEKNQWYKPSRATREAMANASQPLVTADDVLSRLQHRRAAQGVKSATNRLARAKRRAGQPVHGKAPLLNHARMVGGRTLRIDSHLRLAELMRNAGPVPTNDAEQAALERSMFLADLLESLLLSMERARQQQSDFAMQMHRKRLALEDAKVRQGAVDRELRRAEAALERWLVNHPLRARYRMATDEHRILVDARNRAAKHVERMHSAVITLIEEMSDIAGEKGKKHTSDNRVAARIIETMSGYKPEFRTVAEALRLHLTTEQNADISDAAHKLGVTDAETVSLNRSEAPFSKGKRL